MSGAADTVSSPQILVVEDELKVAGALRQGLEAEGYRVRLAHTGEDGFFLASSEPFELVILDRMLPGRDGLEILGALRRKGLLTPVLILTARDGVEDRVAGLDAGADDYLVKPFAFAELLARVRALVRRSRGDQLLRLVAGELTLDVPARVVTCAGRRIDLTTREYELLEYLVRHKGTLSPARCSLATSGEKPSAARHWTTSSTCTSHACGRSSSSAPPGSFIRCAVLASW
jgi:two-component system copper resistance phosphate regulon response regulator CusR